MRKTLLYLALFACASTFAQDNKERVSFGLKYSYKPDFNQERMESGLFMNSFKVHKSDIGIFANYRIFKSLSGQTEAGLSLYDARLYIYPDNKLNNYKAEGVSNKNVYLAQEFACQVYSVPVNAINAKITLSPFLRFYYSFNTNRKEIKRGYPHLDDDYAQLWVEKYQLPLIDATYKLPSGYFSATPGLNIDVLFNQKIALNIFGGYDFGLSGHTQVDAAYRWGSIKRNLSFKSKDSGIYFGAAIKYYLK